MVEKGRKVHGITERSKAELKRIEINVKQYHKWTAYAAAAQHNGEMKADHDKREGPRPKRKKMMNGEPKQDQRILSRIPWGARSQGMALQLGPHNKNSKCTTEERHPDCNPETG